MRGFFFSFLFFFFFSLLKTTTEICFGSIKMEILYREKTFHAGKKITKNDFTPSEKYACYAPVQVNPEGYLGSVLFLWQKGKMLETNIRRFLVGMTPNIIALQNHIFNKWLLNFYLQFNEYQKQAFHHKFCSPYLYSLIDHCVTVNWTFTSLVIPRRKTESVCSRFMIGLFCKVEKQ